MSDYKELISDLRDAEHANWKRLSLDAAAAIEELDAEETRLLLLTSDLQDKLMDLQTEAYKHGYADGWDEAMAKMEVQE